MSKARILVIAGALVAATAAGWAQGAGGARIAGRVVDGVSGKPLSGALVAVTGRGLTQRAVVDRDGRFTVGDIPSGAYLVQATKPGYVGGAAGQQKATGLPRPIEIGPAAPPADLVLRLWKLAVIDGGVFGDGNEPLVGVDVHALRRSLVGGRWRLIETASAVTDDRGRYRLSSLLPGDYDVVVRPARTRDLALLLATLSANPAYAADIMTAATMSGHGDPELDPAIHDYALATYPAAASASRAPFISLEAAGERTSVDFHLKSGRVFRVSGVASGTGLNTTGLVVKLIPAEPETVSTTIDMGSGACDDEGRFSIAGVPAGRYFAVAQTAPSEPTLWARTPVVVTAADVSGVTLAVHRGFTVSGRVSADSATAPSASELTSLAIRLDPIDQPPPAGNAPVWRGRVEPDGLFVTMGVPPGEYLLRVTNPPRGWTIQSAMIGGHDVLDRPIAITDRDVEDGVISIRFGPLGSLSGVVRDAAGLAASDSTVIVFPSDREFWRDSSALSRRLRAVRPLSSGAYGVQNLPAGDYFVAAISGDPATPWQDPQQLETLARRATRAGVSNGATHAIDVQVQR